MNNLWYTKNLLMSKNKIISMALGARGTGKTYCYTSWCISDYKNTGSIAIWVRRWQTELDEILENDKFFRAVKQDFPNDVFTIKKNTAYINEEPFLYFVALSTSRSRLKGIAISEEGAHTCNKIIFDEFLIDSGSSDHYIGACEPEILLDLIESVDRMHDRVHCVLLANALSIINPYFAYFNVKADFTGVKCFGEVAVEIYENKAYIEKKLGTRFGQLVNGTRYGDYAINNQWLLDDNTFVEDMPTRSDFLFIIKMNNRSYGVWKNTGENLLYISDRYNPTYNNIYAASSLDHNETSQYITSMQGQVHLGYLKQYFEGGKIRFQTLAAKSDTYDFLLHF